MTEKEALEILRKALVEINQAGFDVILTEEGVEGILMDGATPFSNLGDFENVFEIIDIEN